MLRPRFLGYKEANDLVPQAREYQMPSLSDWKVPTAAQPKPEEYGYDLEQAFNAVVGLRAIIPADARVFGALTFWVSLYDRPYFYSWNRTSVKYAVDHGVNYMILNDRVLLHGSGQGTDDWAERREEANAFVKDHATLIGHVPNSFYGDLEIYHVNVPGMKP